MKKITGITRRDIIELFQEGYTETSLFGDTSDKYFYRYYGRLTELDFLEKLYPLEDMPSDDLRFKNAKEDIWQHTINNDDYEFGWVFNDARFGLLKGDDTVLLKFLCAVFHPENRNDQGFWKEYFNKINALIRVDGYEFYVSDKISGREIYSWRPLSQEEVLSGEFKPFSIRHKKAIEANSIKLSIPKKIRRKIIEIFIEYDGVEDRRTETNWNYSASTKEAVLEDIREHYIPKNFNAKSKYIETESFEDFILHNYPYQVFDAIELFASYNRDNAYSTKINDLLISSNILYKLQDGKINLVRGQVQVVNKVKEQGVKDLISQAIVLNRSMNVTDKETAVEKLWDAFERLKTYHEDLTKKQSVHKIIKTMSKGNKSYEGMFNKEFKELTDIGNGYRIRHHEMNKIEISDINYYEYLFQRCLALINLTLNYLEK